MGGGLIVQYAERAGHNHMPGLVFAYDGGGRRAAFRQYWRTPGHVVRIAGQDMDKAIGEHPLAPILWAAAESAGQRTRRDLHPDSGPNQPHHQVVMALDPGQAFGMREDRDIAGRQETKETLVDARGGDMVRRLEQDISRIGERQQPARPQAPDQIGNDMHIGARHQAQIYPGLVQMALQSRDRRTDVRTAIVPDARHDMRRAGLHSHAARYCGPGHGERHIEILRPVVDPGQYVTVQINHA